MNILVKHFMLMPRIPYHTLIESSSPMSVCIKIPLSWLVTHVFLLMSVWMRQKVRISRMQFFLRALAHSLPINERGRSPPATPPAHPRLQSVEENVMTSGGLI